MGRTKKYLGPWEEGRGEVGSGKKNARLGQRKGEGGSGGVD